MWCPRCANDYTKVIGTVKGCINERSRRCPSCGYTFMSIEAIKTDEYWEKYEKHTLFNEGEKKEKTDERQGSFDFE